MKNLTHARLLEVLSYDKQTGIFTRNFSCHGNPAARVVGTNVNHKRYIRLLVDGKTYPAHHLAWFYVYGEWPVGIIDHIDRNPQNNAIANLRCATQSENMHNQTIAAQKNNKRSGLRGVCYHNRCTIKPWQASICVQGKRISLGYFDTPEKAHEAYLRAKAIHHPSWPGNNEVL